MNEKILMNKKKFNFILSCDDTGLIHVRNMKIYLIGLSLVLITV